MASGCGCGEWVWQVGVVAVSGCGGTAVRCSESHLKWGDVCLHDYVCVCARDGSSKSCSVSRTYITPLKILLRFSQDCTKQ